MSATTTLRCTLGLVLAASLSGCFNDHDPAASATASTSITTSSSTEPTNTGSSSTTAEPSSTTSHGSSTGVDSSSTSTTVTTDLPTGGAGVCGDGILDPGEECDLGPDNHDEGSCTTSCSHAMCGDGLVQEVNGEQCDDGLANSDMSGCTLECMLAVCGDGHHWIDVEECDDGSENQVDLYAGCTPMTCTKGPHCGDGEVQKPNEECDLGEAINGADGEPCNGGCKLAGRVVFVTSTFSDGALGGLPGADDKCNTLAMEAGLANAGSFMAWLSTGEASPSSRMTQHDEPYLLLDGETTIAQNWGDLTDGSLGGAIKIDETGALHENTRVWTGTEASGEASSPTCQNWTSGLKGVGGLRGSSSQTNSTWSADSVTNCATSARLVCVEQ